MGVSTNCALAIGGVDPGGGAGVLADMRAFAHAGVFGTAAVTLLTVQSTAGLEAVRAVAADFLLDQVRAVVKHQHVKAVKVGALGSPSNVRAIGDWLATLARSGVPSVVDTVMLPSRGHARLLGDRALGPLRRSLLPRATLVTANVPEATLLTGLAIRGVADATSAARALVEGGARAALVKGGHLSGTDAVDVVCIRAGRRNADHDVTLLGAKRIPGGPIHGTGCTLASLIAGRLASKTHTRAGGRGAATSDAALVEACRWAKRAHHEALVHAADVGGPMRVLFAT